ncbi:MAG: head GIN domain-containing protein [Bacteroidota bacterium]
MKYVYYLSIGLCLTLVHSSCGKIELECERGDGDLETRNFDLPLFSGIELNMAADVFLTQGPFDAVTVEAQSNIMDLMDLDIISGRLRIDTRRCVQKREKITLFVTIPSIDFLEINGAGNIYGQNNFTSGNLFLHIDGSGDMDLGLNADLINAFVDGSGNFKVDGTCNRLDVQINGSGEFRSFDLISGEAEVEINGSGEAEVFVNNFLRVFIDGRGEVFFRGNPDVFESIRGRGGVINAN